MTTPLDPTKIKPLGVMILGLLREADMHPYEMMRHLRERRDDRLVTIQNGTFYHQVAVLLRDGYIAEVSTDRDGARPERTTYTLQESGTRAVVSWVRSRLGQIEKHSDFRVALSEAHNLDRTEALRLLAQRQAQLTEKRDAQREAIDTKYADIIDPQFLIEVERDTAILTADIAWTEAVRHQISDPAFAWGYPSQQHRDAKLKRKKHDEHS